MPDLIAKNEPIGALREVTVSIVDLLGDPVAGIDETDVTIKSAKSGAGFVASSATLTAISGAVEDGGYLLRFPLGECDTVGDLKFEITSGTTTIARVFGYVTIDSVIDVAELATEVTVDVVAGLKTMVIDGSGSTPATWFGHLKRMESIVGGGLTITTEGAALRFTWKNQAGATVFTGLIDIAARTRGASDITGSE